MAILKCKMCGGDLNVTGDEKVVECEYCGSKQTVPDANNEKQINLFNRANRLRIACDFDKASSIYEQIIAEFPEEAEAYWGLCLSNYGIEYVDDPATATKIPTCHRASFEKMRKDENYELALENADMASRIVYEDQAKEIDRIMGEILTISRDEKPYDIFICYKESDNLGNRTPDSVLAQDIFDALNSKGYRVFFSRISLEDKLGMQYEPYIFSALNSAKLMLVVGTDYEYMHSVWVKNEWSRFLKLMSQDKEKHLIPCYKDMDPYDMPNEFKNLQSQDCSKIGFMQDLIRGIDKLFGKSNEKEGAVQAGVVVSGGPQASSLLERAFMFLEDGDWNSANEYCEKVLDIEPKNAEAYLAKLMADLHIFKKTDLKNYYEPFDTNINYQKIVRFADDSLKSELQSYLDYIVQGMGEKKELLSSLREKYTIAHNYFSCGWDYTVGLKFDGTVVAVGKNQQGQCDVSNWRNIDAVACGKNHTAGLKSDGTVLAVGRNGYDQCNVSDWRDIIAISCGDWHTIGLKSDGTVVAVGDNNAGQCHVSDWRDIIAISCGSAHTVGLKSDGTVVAVGRIRENQCNVSDWRDVVSISCGDEHTVGLKSDGTVVAVGNNDDGKCNVSDWREIVFISCSAYHTVGIKSNGTVVAVGDNNDGQCNVSDWRDIVAVACGRFYTIGLKSDGTVVAVGRNDKNQCNVSDWRDIVSISYGLDHTVGLKSDGTVVAVGNNDDGQCNVSDWRLFDSIDTIETEKKVARQKQEAEHQKLIEVARQKQRKNYNALKENYYIASKALSCSYYHIVGVKSNGTVIAVGDNSNGKLKVDDWRSIIAISCGERHTVGLKSDGTIIAVGDNSFGQCEVDNWQDIIAISCSERHTVGLRLDGTVVAVGDNSADQCNVENWRDIIAISCTGGCHTVGLKSDGTVVAVGDNSANQCNVDDWQDIIAVYSGFAHTVGLKADGMVIAVGDNSDGQCNVGGWRDIVAISCGSLWTLGLKVDGTIVATDKDIFDEYHLGNWKLFKNIDTIQSEREGFRLKQIAELIKEENNLKDDLSKLTGIFSGSKRRELESKIIDIENQIAQLKNSRKLK